MIVLESNEIKKDLEFKIKQKKNKRLLIASQGDDKSVLEYKKSIIKRCENFSIDFIDLVFLKEENHFDIAKKINSQKDIDGYIILQPLEKNVDISFLRENIKQRDLDGFSFDSLGKIMSNDFSTMTQTAKSVVRFLNFYKIDLSGKNIVIANSNNVIGRPLAMYLNFKKATVTLFNSKTKNQEEKIKKCDIFISAIGKANYYDKKYFNDGQVLIDVGINFENGKICGDIDLDSIKDLDVDIVTSKKGIGSITTLSLLESL